MSESSHARTSPDRFPWQLFGFGLLAGTGAHWLGLALLHLLMHDKTPWWLAAATLIASFGLAAFYHWLRQRNRWPRNWRQATPQVALVWLVFIAALWFAVVTEGLLKGFLEGLAWGDPWLWLAGLGLLLLGTSIQVYERLLEEIQGVRELGLRQDGEDEGAEAMILFLSTPNFLPAFCDSGEGMHARVEFAEGAVAALRGQSLSEDIDAISRARPERGRPWNWQQVLRALEPHGSLKQLWLIGSKDADHYECPADRKGLQPSAWPAGLSIDPNSGKGSADFAESCRRLLKPYTKAEIHVCERAVSFERYQDTMDTARDVLLARLRGVASHRVVVDITGGTKITSIVGATLTLNRGTRLQYVDTQAPHAVIPFLLATEHPIGTHGH